MSLLIVRRLLINLRSTQKGELEIGVSCDSLAMAVVCRHCALFLPESMFYGPYTLLVQAGLHFERSREDCQSFCTFLTRLPC